MGRKCSIGVGRQDASLGDCCTPVKLAFFGRGSRFVIVVVFVIVLVSGDMNDFFLVGSFLWLASGFRSVHNLEGGCTTDRLGYGGPGGHDRRTERLTRYISKVGTIIAEREREQDYGCDHDIKEDATPEGEESRRRGAEKGV